MAEPMRQEVVSLAGYLRSTIRRIDEMMGTWQAQRDELSLRLALIEGPDDPAVAAAAADYESRVEEGRPYEEAVAAEELIKEAHRRFGP